MVDEGLAKLIEELRIDFTAKFERLEALLETSKNDLTSAKREVATLTKAMEEKEREVSYLKWKANDQEQYARSWSIRILDLAIPAGLDASDPDQVMQTVYDKLLKPILEGAVSKKLLPSLPHYTAILETAHILPSKANQTPPIIARFYSRNIKAMMFRLKKEFAAKQPSSQTLQSQPGPQTRQFAKLAFPFYEDLTTANFKKMRAIAQDNRVLACWSVAGQLRFRLNGEDRVRKVQDIFATVDSIIQKSDQPSLSNSTIPPRPNPIRTITSNATRT